MHSAAAVLSRLKAQGAAGKALDHGRVQLHHWRAGVAEFPAEQAADDQDGVGLEQDIRRAIVLEMLAAYRADTEYRPGLSSAMSISAGINLRPAEF